MVPIEVRWVTENKFWEDLDRNFRKKKLLTCGLKEGT